MQVKATFEELDWKGNLVRKAHTYKHPFKVDADVLLKASIEGSHETLRLPSAKSPRVFILEELDFTYQAFTSLVRAEATFKGWKLVIWDKKVKSDGKMRWEMT